MRHSGPVEQANVSDADPPASRALQPEETSMQSVSRSDVEDFSVHRGRSARSVAFARVADTFHRPTPNTRCPAPTCRPMRRRIATCSTLPMTASAWRTGQAADETHAHAEFHNSKTSRIVAMISIMSSEISCRFSLCLRFLCCFRWSLSISSLLFLVIPIFFFLFLLFIVFFLFPCGCSFLPFVCLFFSFCFGSFLCVFFVIVLFVFLFVFFVFVLLFVCERSLPTIRAGL